jgi:hypothetical protein
MLLKETPLITSPHEEISSFHLFCSVVKNLSICFSRTYDIVPDLELI